MPTNPLLQQERDKASFPVELMTHFLDEGKERTDRRREMEKWILNDPAWNHPPLEFLSREEVYATQLHKAAMCHRLMDEKGITDAHERYWVKRLLECDYGSPMDIHNTMFVPSILGQGTDEQIDRWLGPAVDCKILGTYAQTEMGHGTFLRGIETTATYDRSTQEFVLDTPTVTATKWWPGSLGKTTNHAVVMAKLILDGQVKGSHLFFLRTRDEATHQPMPGVTLGDIGPKFGYLAIDNGFMRLQRVRVPRENMLMRHARVTPDGRYEGRLERKDGGDKLSYGTMVFVRSILVGMTSRALARAVTVASRYSSVRLQGHIGDSCPEGNARECRLIDYPTQQHKLLPLLATAYALYFVGEHIRTIYFDVASEVADGRLDRLSEHHALSSCLKAVSSEVASAGVEQCRKACGGHGYSLASGLPQLYMHLTPACTYEGDTTVLLLQTARYLLKCHSEVSSRPDHLQPKLPPSVSYIGTPQLVDPLPFDVSAPKWLCAQLQERTRRMLAQVGASFQAQLNAGTSWQSAFQNHAIRMSYVAKMHASQYIMANFCNVLEECGELRPVLTHLASLYGLHTLLEETGDFLQTACIIPECVARCQAAFERTLAALRPNMIGLTDAFDFQDRELNSVLGRYDGQVYDNLYAWAKASPLNHSEVISSFETTIRPLTRGEPLPPLAKL